MGSEGGTNSKPPQRERTKPPPKAEAEPKRSYPKEPDNRRVLRPNSSVIRAWFQTPMASEFTLRDFGAVNIFRVVRFHPISATHAHLAELVDAADLKSAGPKARPGSSPGVSTWAPGLSVLGHRG